MAPEIARFPVKCFYKGMVQNSQAVLKTKAIDANATPNIETWTSSADLVFECLPRYVFVNVLGSENADAQNGLANKAEATLAVAIAKHILHVPGVENDTTICLLTFYRKQSSLMHDLVRRQLPRSCETGQVQVHTVDSYQGCEADVVILSGVRTNRLGFLQDYRRINVAITRAKRRLFFLGSADLLMEAANSAAKGQCMRKLIADARQRDLILPEASLRRVLKPRSP